MTKLKWSDSRSEGLILKRITTAIDKKTTTEKLNDLSLDDLMELGRQMAYISVQKSNLAKNSDWEIRITDLEKARQNVEEKQAAIELQTRQQNK